MENLIPTEFLDLDHLSKRLFKNHLINKEYSIKESELFDLDFAKQIRFFRLEKFVFEKDAKVNLKLRSVYSSLHSLYTKLVFKVVSDGDSCEIFLGIKADKNVSDYSKVLKGAMEGNFQGTTFTNNKELSNEEIEKLNQYSIKNAQEVTSVLGIPSVKKEDEEEFLQGIENLIFGMQGRPFTALFIANPVKHEEVLNALNLYEKLYSDLSHLKERVENKGLNSSFSDTKGTSSSNSKTKGTNESKTTNSSPWFGKRLANTIGGTGSSLGGYADNIADIINSKTGKQLLKKSAVGSKTGGASENENLTNTNSSSETNSSGYNEGFQLTHTNKKVSNFLDKLDKQIERLESGKGQGFWNVGAYFLSEVHQNSVIAANIYAGIITGEKSNIEPNAIRTFNISDKKEFTHLKNYLTAYEIPRIEIIGDEGFLANAINTNELTIQISLPTKSVPGLDVVEVAPFGSNLKKGNSKKSIEVGNLFNYDKKYKTTVSLDYNKFTSHIFITGSTGSGKSNVTYNLLDKLYRHNIKFLVIEPAKGEYKDIFGSYKNVNVFGTNPNLSHVLKINPFSFPVGIHIYEHIDRFIEILNACWPMEAAMPAVLKEAIEQTYICKGWDLINSINLINEEDFPTFHDLLKVLPEVISNSGYSHEIKSNYEGALVTRVKSLTNGLLNLVFDKIEHSNETLFDENVIVDLSRIPSSETKSLLMGILFMKLNEYRISTRTGNNSDLKHVTVLEEAHNLLKRTSTEQSSNSSNLQGKSVEMISNSIAEMRTYGEGFILADQAPGLMDMAAIRNTNTKICLRLPDFDDRELVGKAMNLSEEQIQELASLKTGVAAVFQNDWQESILCQFHLFENKKSNYQFIISIPEREFQLKLAKIAFEGSGNQNPDLMDLKKEYCNEPYIKNYESIIQNLNNNKIAMEFVFDILNIESIHKATIYNAGHQRNQNIIRRNFKKNLINAYKPYYSNEFSLKIYNHIIKSLEYAS